MVTVTVRLCGLAGGNIGFESAAFKLSHEMTQLIDPGQKRKSPQFLRFVHLCIQVPLYLHYTALRLLGFSARSPDTLGRQKDTLQI